jgi:hypothetical protein
MNMPVKNSKKSDAISILKGDHRKVAGLFEKFENSRSKIVKAKLAHEICLELSVHTQIEETLFYPAIKKTVDADLHDESYVEHDGAKALIAEILASKPDADFYDAKVKVLSEQIKHHVKEEEQRGGLFAQAKDDGDVDLVALGAAMGAMKSKLIAQMKAGGVPTPMTRSMNGAPLKHGSPVA